MTYIPSWWLLSRFFAADEKELLLFADMFGRTFSRYPRFLHSSVSAAVGAELPPGLRPALDRLISRDIAGLRKDYGFIAATLSMPAAWRDPSRPSELIRASLLVGQTQFARMNCRASETERELTGKLRTQIGTGVALVNGWNRKVFSAQVQIQIWAVGLALKKREKALGGDVVFIFEVEDPDDLNKTVVFACCLQAKKANPPIGLAKQGFVDIRRKRTKPQTEKAKKAASLLPPDDGYDQLRALQNSSANGIPSGYIFYHNDETKLLNSPHWPLVKEVQDLEPNLTTDHKTDLGSEPIDLAGYFARLFARVKSIGTSGDDDIALADLVSRVTVGSPSQIVCLSSSAGFELRLKRILSKNPNTSNWAPLAIDLSAFDFGASDAEKPDFSGDDFADDDDIWDLSTGPPW